MNEKLRIIQGIGLVGIIIGAAIVIINAAPAFLKTLSFGLIQVQTGSVFGQQITEIGIGICLWGIVFLIGLPAYLYLMFCFFKDLLTDKINKIRGYEHL